MRMNEMQFACLKDRLKAASNSEFYKKKFKESGFCPEDVRTPEDIVKIPFSSKEDLRNAYPLGLQAVPDSEVVRIHSSSGTTGLPVIIPYTAQDVTDWSIMMARCFETAGITKEDRFQITPGYGLWTAGIGFQAGVERLGAMAVPMGPGNTEKQIQMMVDLETVINSVIKRLSRIFTAFLLLYDSIIFSLILKIYLFFVLKLFLYHLQCLYKY